MAAEPADKLGEEEPVPVAARRETAGYWEAVATLDAIERSMTVENRAVSTTRLLCAPGGVISSE
jgi:hypothetical protein